ncbi:heme o synthase [Paenibacillus urinalis]|uniref:Protoheme IX farnesyltransferase n=2 Tax=Bacteria TaxID=2 RepID=A0AAX3MT03_9BACL|nr:MULTISPECIES: heme o synthase [Paenibacillus]WDH80751.1 heme o synthase [Paenibacillus urinalis]WDH96804.1 heme o synthase [Paenibacillus urinalis]WDI00447.1 heme o synthase [Paenibacillus urinalis]GAK39124.1 protein CtaB [Paenibacillus sp. TCA20]
MSTINNSSGSSAQADVQSLPQVFFATIKTGIIKSNLIAMFAGLSMALYVFNVSFIDHLGAIILSIIGSSLVIGSAGTFNNLYDRDIDAIMQRTKDRPTVTGKVDTKSGLILGFLMSALGILLLYLSSPMAAFFGFLGLFLYVVPYTMWTKRTTIYNTEVGSISGAVPPLIGWSVISSELGHFEIWALVATMLIWQMPHFYAIAIRRLDEYKAAKVPMLPVVKGIKRTYLQTNFYLILLIASSALFWPFNPYIAGIAFALSLAWFIFSLVSYRKSDITGWAKKMFIFSLNHMTLLFLIVIIFSLIAQMLR